MKQTIAYLAAAIIDHASGIGIEAEALADHPGIAGAKCIIHLCNAQQAMNHASDALRLAIANRADGEKPPAACA